MALRRLARFRSAPRPNSFRCCDVRDNAARLDLGASHANLGLTAPPAA
jgi:hypothetical protein